MQTQLADFIRDTPEGREAEAILRKCVHCGLCTATCPTYHVLGGDHERARGRASPRERQAVPILRKCVHCGSCTATCPTYQVLGDDLDSPRGRIYLMKRALEGGPVTEKTRLHLDRCLTCRACETTCPSGVQYGRL